jgi:hypothetical protein
MVSPPFASRDAISVANLLVRSAVNLWDQLFTVPATQTAEACGTLRAPILIGSQMISSNRVRQWHAYIGLFIAPSVLFFAITGAIQLFNLHEAHGSYRPAVLVQMLSAVHKDQVFEQPRERTPHSEDSESAVHSGGAEEHPSNEADEEKPTTLALKWFFLLVGLGLTLSTSIGVWMGLTQVRRQAIGWSLLAAGAVIPTCLLAI